MERLVSGIVRTSHGIRGHIKVASLSGEVEHLLSLDAVSVSIRGREVEYRIEEARAIPGGVIMKFIGVDSPEVARTLSGGELLVPRGSAAPLREGEYYQADLIGCRVVHGGETVGEVRAIYEGGKGGLLEVVTLHGVHIVPFVDHYIGEVDPEQRTIELLKLELLQ